MKLKPWEQNNRLAKLKLQLHIAKRDLNSKRYKSIALISEKVRIVQQLEARIKKEVQKQCN